MRCGGPRRCCFSLPAPVLLARRNVLGTRQTHPYQPDCIPEYSNNLPTMSVSILFYSAPPVLVKTLPLKTKFQCTALSEDIQKAYVQEGCGPYFVFKPLIGNTSSYVFHARLYGTSLYTSLLGMPQVTFCYQRFSPNKLASLEATLVRNYDSLTYPLTDRGKV